MLMYQSFCVQMTALNEFSPLCTFLETILTMIWWAQLLSVQSTFQAAHQHWPPCQDFEDVAGKDRAGTRPQWRRSAGERATS